MLVLVLSAHAASALAFGPPTPAPRHEARCTSGDDHGWPRYHNQSELAAGQSVSAARHMRAGGAHLIDYTALN